jgi:hypothetical protein
VSVFPDLFVARVPSERSVGFIHCFLFSFLLHAQKKRNKEKGATKTAIPTRASRTSRTFPERPSRYYRETSAARETSGEKSPTSSVVQKRSSTKVFPDTNNHQS